MKEIMTEWRKYKILTELSLPQVPAGSKTLGDLVKPAPINVAGGSKEFKPIEVNPTTSTTAQGVYINNKNEIAAKHGVQMVANLEELVYNLQNFKIPTCSDSVSCMKMPIDYIEMFIRMQQGYEQLGFKGALAAAFAKNTTIAAAKSANKLAAQGRSVLNTTTFCRDWLLFVRELVQTCIKYGIDAGGYLERFLAITAEGTLIGGALTVLGFILVGIKIGDWLTELGKEFKKSSGSTATKELREIEERIKKEGFAEVKRDIANTSINQMQIFKKLNDAAKLNPFAPLFFPTVVDLLPGDLQKHFREKKSTGWSDATKAASKSTVQLGSATTNPESRWYRGQANAQPTPKSGTNTVNDLGTTAIRSAAQKPAVRG